MTVAISTASNGAEFYIALCELLSMADIDIPPGRIESELISLCEEIWQENQED